tara:strand:- start:5911 stop:6738 length:828 start_codon:yes stop_codon:yes gene_type:complete
MKATSTSQGHVTGFFKIYSNGSTGAGFNIQNGMKTTVEATKANKNNYKIYINGKKTNSFTTSQKVLKKILAKTKQKFEITVKHETEFPIGYGLGISGAGALSLANALNKAMKLRISKKEIVNIATKAEIEAGTGLGDVIAEQYSGVIMGLSPYPSKKAGKIKNNYKYAVFGFFGPLETKKIIKNRKWKSKINKIGSYCMRSLSKKKNMQNFIRLSRVFSIETNLVSKKVREIMNEIPNCSMAMLGNTVFVLTNNPKEIEKQLKKYTKKTSVGKIS